MKSISQTLATHIQQEMTSLATMWTILRRDGSMWCFTDFDTDLFTQFSVRRSVETWQSNFFATIGGGSTPRYISSAGFTKSNLADAPNLNKAGNVQLDGALDATFITDTDIRNRLWDYAIVIVTMVNWVNGVAGNYLNSADDVRMFTGQFGPVTLKEYSWSVELRGLVEYLNREVGDLYSPTCRVDLGSPACGVNLAALTQTGNVISTDGVRNMNVGGVGAATGYFDGGLVTWLTGANAGYSIDVKQFIGLGTLGGTNQPVASAYPTALVGGYSGAWTRPNFLLNGSGDTGDGDQAGGDYTCGPITVDGFGFAIPAGATIIGLGVSFYAGVEPGGLGAITVTLNQGGSSTIEIPNIEEGYVLYTAGGEGTMWNVALTPAMVNNSSFGITFASIAHWTWFYNVQVTVFYTPASTTGNTGGNITLFSRSTFPIQAGDTFLLAPGCDKLFSTCQYKFFNAVNFQGENAVPSPDHILFYPDVKLPVFG